MTWKVENWQLSRKLRRFRVKKAIISRISLVFSPRCSTFSSMYRSRGVVSWRRKLNEWALHYSNSCTYSAAIIGGKMTGWLLFMWCVCECMHNIHMDVRSMSVWQTDPHIAICVVLRVVFGCEDCDDSQRFLAKRFRIQILLMWYGNILLGIWMWHLPYW